MLDKAIDFLITVAADGFIALFISFFAYILLAIVFMFVMIPVSIIAGDGIANSINNFAGGDIGFKLVYAIVFISLLMDDLGIPNVKTAFKKWRANRKG